MLTINRLKKTYASLLISLFLLSILSSCQVFNRDIQQVSLSSQKQQQVNSLLANSLTRCIGVYLIDLPVEFTASKESRLDYQYNHGITITTKQQYLPPFKQMLTLYEQELKNTKPVDPIDNPYLKAIYPVHTTHPDKMQGIIFERMESIGTADASRVLEGYRWQDDVTLKIEMKARNGLAKKYDEDRLSSPRLYGNNIPQKLLELRKLFERIKPRDDLTIPTTPGFCLLNSFMQGEDREWKDMGFIYRHNSIADFYFRITSNDFAGDYALLDKPESYVTQGRGHTIHKGTRESQGLQLEEWIAKGQYFLDEKGFESDDEGYVFVLGINMTDSTYKSPQLRIKMFYKIPEDKTQGYTEEQLMVIWREITNSIKIRESSFGTE